MTDRFKGVVVTFEKEMRSDDAEELINAIRCLRNVADVAPSVDNIDDHMNRTRVRRELLGEVFELIQKKE